jgi:hypothetical protein
LNNLLCFTGIVQTNDVNAKIFLEELYICPAVVGNLQDSWMCEIDVELLKQIPQAKAIDDIILAPCTDCQYTCKPVKAPVRLKG